MLPLLLILMPVALVLEQPDLGTACCSPAAAR